MTTNNLNDLSHTSNRIRKTLMQPKCDRLNGLLKGRGRCTLDKNSPFVSALSGTLLQLVCDCAINYGNDCNRFDCWGVCRHEQTFP